MNQKNSAPVLACSTGSDGRVNFISPGWLELTGKSLKQTIKDGWLADIHPQDRGLVEPLLSSSRDKREAVELTFRLKHVRGEYNPVTAWAWPGYSDTGVFSGWAVWVEAEHAGPSANPIFELISNNMREIVCLLSKDARIEFISPAVESILGYTPEELVGQIFPPTIVPSKLKPGFMEIYSSLSEAEGPQYIEVPLPSRAGDLVWLELDLQFLRDESGALVNLQVVARDVTTRKQNEEILRLYNEVAEALWKTADLQDSLREVLRIVLTIEGVDSGGVYVPDPASGHLNLITQTGLSKTFAESVSHYPPNHPLIVMARSGQSLFGNFPDLVTQIEDETPQGSDEEGILGIAAIPIMYKNQLIAIFNLASHSSAEIPTHSRKILQFITLQIGALIARNRTETALRESEEKFRSFFEQSTDIMSLVDENGVVCEWNPSSEALTGVLKSEVVSRSGVDVHFDLLPPEKKSARMYRTMQERYLSAQRDGKSAFLNRIIEGQVQQQNGKRRFFQQVVFPIPTAKGVMLGSTGRDVTELKMAEKAEMEQRRLTEALIDSASALNSSLDQEKIFQNIFDLTGKIVESDGGSLMLIDGENGVFRKAWSTGSLEEELAALEATSEYPIAGFPALLHLYQSAQPLLVGDIHESRFFQTNRKNDSIHSFLGVPVCIKKRVTGILCLFSARTNHFEEKHAGWLQAFANQAALAIENARLFARVEQLAVLDELTHVYNRRGFNEIGERELERARRFKRPLSALFIDVDHFKEINDTYSHSAGDKVLQAVTACAGELLRSVDVIGRYGGEEFVILLPETDVENARATAERLRAGIENRAVPTSHGEIKVTVSIGVSGLTKDIPSLAALLGQADAAVHRAKAAGRNRVEVG